MNRFRSEGVISAIKSFQLMTPGWSWKNEKPNPITIAGVNR